MSRLRSFEREEIIVNEKIKIHIAGTVQELIEEGLLEVATVDEDGNFCYGLTAEGQKAAVSKSDLPEKEPA